MYRDIYQHQSLKNTRGVDIGHGIGFLWSAENSGNLKELWDGTNKEAGGVTSPLLENRPFPV